MKSLFVNALLFFAFLTPLKAQISGFEFMGKDLQEMQMNDAANPSFLWVKEGEKLFKQECVSCHTSMETIALNFPKNHKTLEEQINFCRVERVKKEPLKEESKQLLSLESYIALQSRDKIIDYPHTSKSGEEFYTKRQGQLNLSCASCHAENSDKTLFSAKITQGQTNGYPLYRLEWQGVGSLKRRLKNCLVGMRAEIPSNEILRELEIYLKSKSNGLRLESPAIRP